MKFYKNMKISAKLAQTFLIIALFSVIVGVWGIISMNELERADNDMYTYNTQAMSKLAVMYDTLASQRICANNMMIFSVHNPAFSEEESASLTEKEQLFDEAFEAYGALLSSDEERALYAAMQSLYYDEFAGVKQNVRAAVMSGDEAAMAAAIQEMDSMGSDVSGYMDEAFALNDELAASQVAANKALSSQNTVILIVIMAVGVLISLAFAFVVSGMISKPLKRLLAVTKQVGETGDLEFDEAQKNELRADGGYKDEIGQVAASFGMMMDGFVEKTRQLETIAKGDLSSDVQLVSERDTIGNALLKMLENLNEMFGEIKGASKQVAAGSKQLSAGAQTLAQGSTEQAAAVEQLSSSISEIAKNTDENANMAAKAADFSEKIRTSAQKGSGQMDQMTQAVQEINEASQSISKVIKAIDDIAFQTNLLALNAAVEAARAGSHGKGFAVVAEEVRNLAGRSAEAAKNTGGLIENSMLKAQLGARIAAETAASLAEIVNGIEESTLIVNEIARSSGEQSAAIQQITKGIGQVAQVVQQNSATAQESAAASDDMSRQSDMLEELTAHFTLRSGGDGLLLEGAYRG